VKIEVLPDADSAAQQAAKLIAASVRAAVSERGKFIFAVSGGRTPGQMLRDLTREDVAWQRVHVFQVDERIAPAGDRDRNLTQLSESLLSCVALPPDQVYAMPVESSDLKTAAAQYASMLQKVAGTCVRSCSPRLGARRPLGVSHSR
jgi:6-phosphogluconolactonase